MPATQFGVELTGDFAKLKDAAALLAALPEKARRALLEAAGPEIEALVRAQLAARTTPTGRAWKPLAESTIEKYGQSVPPLGDMIDTVEFPRDQKSITVRIQHPAAKFHQRGVRKGRGGKYVVPSRRLIPYKTKTIPKTWQKALEDARAKVEKQLQSEVP